MCQWFAIPISFAFYYILRLAEYSVNIHWVIYRFGGTDRLIDSNEKTDIKKIYVCQWFVLPISFAFYYIPFWGGRIIW